MTTGGVARTRSFELTGPLAALLLEEVSLDVAFLGVDAVDPVRGLYAHHEAEAGINRLMAARARQVIAVADSSKLGAFAFARICATPYLHTLVTDNAAEASIVAAFEREGVKVVMA